jgi:hypothetical protein
MLVAVPVAAAIGVLMRFVISQYKDSRLYRGLDTDGPRQSVLDESYAPDQAQD